MKITVEKNNGAWVRAEEHEPISLTTSDGLLTHMSGVINRIINSDCSEDEKAAALRVCEIAIELGIGVGYDFSEFHEGDVFICAKCLDTRIPYSERTYGSYDTLYDEYDTNDSDDYSERYECAYCGSDKAFRVRVPDELLNRKAAVIAEFIRRLKEIYEENRTVAADVILEKG